LAGDPAAYEFFATLWKDYLPNLGCFLCDAQVEAIPFTEILPERDKPDKLIATTLCADCRRLAPMLRWSRCLTLLRKMWSSKGKQLHFQAFGR
jgi:hypothetical protein